MNAASGRVALKSEVAELLEANGYSTIPTEVTIGDVQLDVPGLWEGPSDSLDLTIVADSPSSREEELGLYWIVQRLARALDELGSRRTVTLVLIGSANLQQSEVELLELARVLIVDGSLPTARMMGPILRFQLPPTAEGHRDGIEVVSDTISKTAEGRHLTAILQAAVSGNRAVTERYRFWIEEAFHQTGGSNG